MKGFVEAAILEFHGARRFFTSVLESACERGGVTGIVPTYVNLNSVWNNFAKVAKINRIDLRHVYLKRYDSQFTPETFLAEALSVQWLTDKTPHTTQNLLRGLGRCGGAAIALRDFDRLANSLRSIWSQWVCDIETHRRTAPDAPPFILFADGGLDSSFTGRIHSLWGCISETEVRLAIRQHCNEEEGVNLWREHLLASVSGPDAEVISLLWDLPTENTPIYTMEVLRTLAKRRGWSSERLKEWGLSAKAARLLTYHLRDEAFAEMRRELLAEGVVTWTPERGTETHSAALAALQLDDVILHRIWRAQCELILPRIAALRLEISRRLTESFGEFWPTKLGGPWKSHELVDGDGDAWGCSLGRICHVIERLPHPPYGMSKESLNKFWVPLIALCHKLRNHLAHERMVSFADFDRLLKMSIMKGEESVKGATT